MHDEKPTGEVVAKLSLSMNVQQGNEVASVGCVIGGVQRLTAFCRTVGNVAKPNIAQIRPRLVLDRHQTIEACSDVRDCLQRIDQSIRSHVEA